MATDPRELYQKLKTLAENPGASDGEKEMARNVMAGLRRKHGTMVDDWITITITVKSPTDAQLVLHAAATHKCRIRQEVPHFHLEGSKEVVERVHEDYKAYSPKLEDILRVAMIGALKGFGIYSESPVGASEGATEVRTPAFPYDVQQLVQRLFSSAGGIGQHMRRADMTLKQLPAPPKKKMERWEPTNFDAFMKELLGPPRYGVR